MFFSAHFLLFPLWENFKFLSLQIIGLILVNQPTVYQRPMRMHFWGSSWDSRNSMYSFKNKTEIGWSKKTFSDDNSFEL